MSEAAPCSRSEKKRWENCLWIVGFLAAEGRRLQRAALLVTTCVNAVMCKDLGTHVKKINGISDGGVTGITSSRYISVSISVSLLSAFSSVCSEIIFLQLCWIDLFLWLLTKDSALFFEIMFHTWCPSQAQCPGTLNRRQCFDSLEPSIITEAASWCCNWRAWKELVADNWWWLELQNWGWWKVGGELLQQRVRQLGSRIWSLDHHQWVARRQWNSSFSEVDEPWDLCWHL